MANGKRLLFFDLLRIVSVALIVFYHVAPRYGWSMPSNSAPLFNALYIYPGAIGVALLIFVSGAVLEYTHPRLESLAAVTGFYVKRLSRIYPAFWMSLIIALTYAPALLRSLQPHILLLEFTGFCAFTGRWSGVINPIAWFIGLIVVLYFLFPFLSASIRERPFLMLFLIAVIEISARYFFHVWYIPELGRWPDKWLPVCNFLEFGLGIWIVQNGFYPKWVHDSRVIGFLAEISFYVFLIHEVGGIFAMSKVSLPAYVIAVGLLSWLMMLGDQGVQVWLKKRLCVIRPEPQR